MKATDKAGGDRSPGEVLRLAREARGVGISEAAEATRIKIQVIEAIERDDYGRIPAPTYAKGFSKLYAEYLGLDAGPLVQAYLDRHVPPDQRQVAAGPPRERTPRKPGASRRATPRWIDVLPLRRVAVRVAVAVAAVVAAVLVLTGLFNALRRSSSSDMPPVEEGKRADDAWKLVAEPPDPLLPVPGEVREVP